MSGFDFFCDGGKPKVIDLDKYGIGTRILYHYGEGGGSSLMGPGEIGTFWSDVTTDKVLRLEQNYDGIRFVIDQCVRVTFEGTVLQVLYSFNAFIINDGNPISLKMDVALIKENETGATTVVVKVA